jgi:hypothetical protein
MTDLATTMRLLAALPGSDVVGCGSGAARQAGAVRQGDATAGQRSGTRRNWAWSSWHWQAMTNRVASCSLLVCI